MIDPVLSAEDVAIMLDCSIDTINAKFSSGELPGLKFGRSWVSPSAALIERLNDLARNAPKQAIEAPMAVLATTAQTKVKSRRKTIPELPQLQ